MATENEERLIALWALAGQAIDEQRLRIFRLMSQAEQKAILESVANEVSVKPVAV